MNPPLQVAQIGQVVVVLYEGDITQIQVHAIANAANLSLLGGGGVDGAIHEAAGHILDAECYDLYKKGGCPAGEARITRGGNLPAQYVIHTVGPKWRGGNRGEADILANCYYNSIELAKQNDITSLIFPSISTGVYGYPVAKAALTAKDSVEKALREPGSLLIVGWCLFDSSTFKVYEKTWMPFDT